MNPASAKRRPHSSLSIRSPLLVLSASLSLRFYLLSLNSTAPSWCQSDVPPDVRSLGRSHSLSLSLSLFGRRHGAIAPGPPRPSMVGLVVGRAATSAPSSARSTNRVGRTTLPSIFTPFRVSLYQFYVDYIQFELGLLH